MKKSLLFVIIALVTSFPALSQSTMNSPVVDKEKSMYEAIKNNDLNTFTSNLADNFMSVYSMGIGNRATELESLKELKMRSYNLSNVQVMQPSDSVAIIAYKLSADGTYKDKDFSWVMYSSSTWLMKGGQWQAVMHTEVRQEPMDSTATGSMGPDAN